MNWEHQLAIDMTGRGESLLPRAVEARDLCRQKKYGKALEVLWEMLLAARRSGGREREAFALIHIGKAYRNWIWDVALKFFQDGLEVARSCGFTRGELAACGAIGELYYAWGKQAEALKYYTRSLETARNLKDRSCERDILLEMVECYGEKGEFDRCDELLVEAAHLDHTLGPRLPGGGVCGMPAYRGRGSGQSARQ